MLAAYEHGFPEWYAMVGKNWSWEATAIAASEEGPQCEETEQDRRQRERHQGKG